MNIIKKAFRKIFPKKIPLDTSPMGMLDLRNVKLNLEPFVGIQKLCNTHYGENAGCRLSGHWQKSFQADISKIKQTKKLEALNWVGEGFPFATPLRSLYPDIYNLAAKLGNIGTLDMQTGLHQFYALDEYFKQQGKSFDSLDSIRVLEVGGGYGRMAIFFLAYFGKRCQYINIDFVPTSLAAAPQVINQLFPELSVMGTLDLENSDTGLNSANFVSLPAWKTNLLEDLTFDIGINIHSFQEMEPETFLFYTNVFCKHLPPGAVLYFVNNPPDSWEEKGINRYVPHTKYGLEQYFWEKKSRVNTFTADWEKICGIPSLERILERK